MGRLDVFAAAAVALVVATALNVAVGGVLRHYVSVRHVQVAAGIRFIVIGARTLLHG
jgi:putative Ca2+/H+ antiporter (TMEM165/GDT1 family)